MLEGWMSNKLFVTEVHDYQVLLCRAKMMRSGMVC